MTQTLEQLQAKVAELEEEKKQLAASQLHAEQLQVALDELVDLMQAIRAEEYKPDSFTCQPALKALALPRDTSALDAYVAEKLSGISEQLKLVIRQRDLAVEAIEKSRPWLSGIANFNSRKAMRILETALYAIKESEEN